MSDAATHDLSTTAIAIVKELRLDGGVVSLPADAEDRWAIELARVPHGDRRAVALDLVAMAVKLRREAPDATSGAMGALFRLVAALLDSDHAAAVVFDAVGLDDARALASVTGAERSNRPVAAVSSKPSLLDVRLGRARPSPDDDG